MTTKTIEITTGFLGEEMTLKIALKELIKETQDTFNELKKVNPKYVPNQHLYIAHIRNCKSLLKKL
jgi:hypothetical protein